VVNISLKYIILEKDNGVATIRMNRPEKLNAMRIEMQMEIVQTLKELAFDDNIKVGVITGVGKAFSSGGDLGDMDMAHRAPPFELRRNLNQNLAEIVRGIWDMEKPVIAAVNGVATGGACNIAMACDIVIASETARFGQIFLAIGLIPDGGGSWLLPRLVGFHKAVELIFSGRLVDAKEAEQLGLVNKVVSAEELEKTAKEYASLLKMLPLGALGATKKAIHKGFTMSLEDALDYEMTMQTLCFQTEENKERVKAFLAKKK
jgi:2-(1,2-epoxy-1,2-dihydrophenyl)acetyl-CoA isomerase